MLTPRKQRVTVGVGVLVAALAGAACGQNNFYGMGSSNVGRLHEWIAAFLEAEGMTGTTALLSQAGAPMYWLWQDRENCSPNPETYLRSCAVDIVYMLPSTVWAQLNAEAVACANFGHAAVDGNPDIRILFEDRKFIEQYTDGTITHYYFEDSPDAASTIENLFRPHGMLCVYKVALEIGHIVHLNPFAWCLEAVKDLIKAGRLDSYDSVFDSSSGYSLYNSRDNQHLGPLGHYIQGAAVWAAGYNLDPRGLPRIITRWSGADTMLVMTQHDADLINQAVYDVVRGTPFSGWHVNEPAAYDEYMDSLREAVRTFETFDNMDTGPVHSGSFTAASGVVWSYRSCQATERSDQVISERTCLLGASPQDPSYLAVTLPRGAAMLTFQYRGRYKLPGPADTYKYRLAVVANGDTVVVLNKIIENGGSPLAYRIENINIQPGGELTFVSNGTDMTRLDNIRWTDYQGVTGSIAVPRRPGVRAQRMGHRDGMLTVAQGVTGPLTIASVDGRLVARRACDGRTAVSLRLAPGAYIAAVSGSGRIDRAMVLAR